MPRSRPLSDMTTSGVAENDLFLMLTTLLSTIIYYIVGDNGASAEGTLNGAFNEMANYNGMAALETPEFMLRSVCSKKPAYTSISRSSTGLSSSGMSSQAGISA